MTDRRDHSPMGYAEDMSAEDHRSGTERSGGPDAPAVPETASAPVTPVAPVTPAAPQTPAPTPTPDRWTVDALEDTPHGPVARLERPDGSTVDVPARHLPDGVREGDLLAVQDGPDGVRFQALPDETRARRTQAQAQLDALNARQAPPTNDQGEIDL